MPIARPRSAPDIPSSRRPPRAHDTPVCDHSTTLCQTIVSRSGHRVDGSRPPAAATTSATAHSRGGDRSVNARRSASGGRPEHGGPIALEPGRVGPRQRAQERPHRMCQMLRDRRLVYKQSTPPRRRSRGSRCRSPRRGRSSPPVAGALARRHESRARRCRRRARAPPPARRAPDRRRRRPAPGATRPMMPENRRSSPSGRPPASRRVMTLSAALPRQQRAW